MNITLQILIAVFAIGNKILLAKEHVLGWWFSIICSALSVVYAAVYYGLPIMVCLEGSFLLLSIYGLYKFYKNNKQLTMVDYWVISLTLITVIGLVVQQIGSHTVWYELVGTVSFLVGIIFLAQKPEKTKLVGWVLYMIGSICLGIIAYMKDAMVLVSLDTVCVAVEAWATVKLIQKILRESHLAPQ
jgi:hypothetical protein